MDIQAYISSGILESYVLGELSAAEAREVEELAARYPELQEELRLVEETLEAVIKAAEVAPPSNLRAELFAKIAPVPAKDLPPTQPASRQENVRLHPSNDSASGSGGAPHWLAAASIGLAVLSSLAAAYFWSRWQATEDQLAGLLAQNTVLVQHVSTLENREEAAHEILAILNSTEFKVVPMLGQPAAPEAQAVVYWHPEQARVLLNPGSLPEAPEGKQYQLWAIVDGKPVDAGVFDTTGDSLLKQMKQIDQASAFAVTLEPRGGSPSPTMEQLYVLGNAS